MRSRTSLRWRLSAGFATVIMISSPDVQWKRPLRTERCLRRACKATNAFADRVLARRAFIDRDWEQVDAEQRSNARRREFEHQLSKLLRIAGGEMIR